MESTVVQTAQPTPDRAKKEYPATPHRWSRWMDGNGKLWIIVGNWRGNKDGKLVEEVEMLDADNEATVLVPRGDYQQWVADGTIKRIDTPILL